MIKYDESMICYIKNFVSEKEVRPINDYINSLNTKYSKDVFYIDKIEEEHSDYRKVENEEVVNIVRNLEQKIHNYITNVYFSNVGLKVVTTDWTRELELIRWPENCTLAAHSDGDSDSPDFPMLNIGSLIYLNNEYNGGEIKFNDYGLEFKPDLGDLVIFPNHYVHEVLIVKKKEPITRRHTMPVFYSFTVEHK